MPIGRRTDVKNGGSKCTGEKRGTKDNRQGKMEKGKNRKQIKKKKRKEDRHREERQSQDADELRGDDKKEPSRGGGLM